MSKGISERGPSEAEKAAAREQAGKQESYDEAKGNPNRFEGGGPGDGVGDWSGPGDGHFARLFPPPGVPSNGEQSGGGVRVSTEALKVFATNIRSLIPTLKAALEQVEKVKIAPGIFHDAHELIVKVTGGGAGAAIQPTTRAFLVKAINAITAVADELEKLAQVYATEEELNAATGKDLGEHIAGAKAEIGKAIGGGVVAA